MGAEYDGKGVGSRVVGCWVGLEVWSRDGGFWVCFLLFLDLVGSFGVRGPVYCLQGLVLFLFCIQL